MKAVRFDGPGAVSLVDVSSRDLAPTEVALAIDRVGVCATDLHIFHGTFPTAVYPLTPGHEATGVVARVGDAITDLAPGTRVVLDPGMPCHRCRYCRRGRLNLCARRRAFGVTDDGAATAELVVPAANCFAVADSTPAAAAVLGEPLACVVHAFDLVAPPAGHSVLVYGAGTVGLMAALVARTLGAASISVVDLNSGRLEQARAVGADGASTDAAALSEQRFDLVVDATGAAPAIADGLTRVDRGGHFLQIGVARPDATVAVAPYELFAREMTIAGSMTTSRSFPRAVALLDAGAIAPDIFTAQPYSLDRYSEAMLAAERGDTAKVTIQPH